MTGESNTTMHFRIRRLRVSSVLQILQDAKGLTTDLTFGVITAAEDSVVRIKNSL